MRWIAARIQAGLGPGPIAAWLGLALLATWFGLGPSRARFAGLAGLDLPDLQPGITPAALLAQVRAYPPAAADYYLQWTGFDFAWPFLAYTAMLFIAAWLLRFAGQPERLWLLVTVAYATVLLDWLENLGFASLVARPAGEPAWLAVPTVYLHRGKLALNLVFNLGFLLALLAAVAAAVRSRPRAPGA